MTVRIDRPVIPGQILFNEEQAAAILGIGYNTLRLLDIPSVRIKTRRLYHRADLEAFAERVRQAS